MRPERAAEINDRAVHRLIAAHATRIDEPLVLAVRYRLADKDVHLLEVLDGFPGDPEDSPYRTAFTPSVDLLLSGPLHLTVVNREQLRALLQRMDPLISQIRTDGRLEYSVPDVSDLVEALGGMKGEVLDGRTRAPPLAEVEPSMSNSSRRSSRIATPRSFQPIEESGEPGRTAYSCFTALSISSK